MCRQASMKILVTPTSFDREGHAAKLLGSFASEIVYNPVGKPLSARELIPLLDGVAGCIAGLDSFSKEAIEGAPATLRVISRYGVGCDRVDIAAAHRRGIVVTTTPGVNSESVADLAFALALSVARRVPVLDRQVKSGGWPRAMGIELYGKTMGIIGSGAIGMAVAARAKGFAMRVLAYDPYADGQKLLAHGIEPVALEELLAGSDVISLHVPLTAETRNIIDGRALALVRPGAILINTSRGGLLDEGAALAALQSGRLGGLGLDAYETEPPGQSPLFGLDNVVATPHAGAHTKEAAQRMAELSVSNLIDVLSGRECRYAVPAPPAL